MNDLATSDMIQQMLGDEQVIDMVFFKDHFGAEQSYHFVLTYVAEDGFRTTTMAKDPDYHQAISKLFSQYEKVKQVARN